MLHVKNALKMYEIFDFKAFLHKFLSPNYISRKKGTMFIFILKSKFKLEDCKSGVVIINFLQIPKAKFVT